MTDDISDADRLGAILYHPDVEIEPILAEVHATLAARGVLRIGGVVPREGEVLANGRRAMLLEDVTSGIATNISQELGAGADSCILDIDGLTRARTAISAAIEAGVDLVLVGKFAKQEIAGHGVREEIGQAVAAGTPTLVALRETRIDDWRAFAGDDFTALPPDVAAIVAWAERVGGR
ncbi:MAG: DUF2478 domain-containing protein [Siculibacillus sp.]